MKTDYQALYLRAYAQYWFGYDINDDARMKKAQGLMKNFATQLDYAPFPPIPNVQTLKSRKANPVPASKNIQIKRASELYENFSGHEAEIVATFPKPEYPDVLIEIGDVDGILYTTKRDGNIEKYIHKFHKDAKPLFCVSPAGDTIYFIGGEYDFTDRGIVDRTDPKQQE